jgi:hypothetical protein
LPHWSQAHASETDRLSGRRVQTQLRAVHSQPGPDKIRKMRELGAHQLIDIDSLPLVPD